MEDFNPRSPIRLSDIDNLLQESIFESSDGAKLVEYLKKKRGGGGRVRLQNIFQQVPVQRAQFNFNLDTTDPTPLPESPEPTTSNAAAAARVPEIVTHNDVPEIAVTEAVGGDDGTVVSPRVPIVMVNDFNAGKKVKQIALKSPGPMNALSRQVLINQYQRTNAAKCELLKQLASSTPKPDSNGSLGRMSTFTTSISPIVEHSPMTPCGEVIPSSQPQPVVMEIVVPPPASQEVILAPCSQAVTDCTPQKVVVLKTVVNPYGQLAIAEEVVIPETPSPAKVVTESPKAAPHTAQMQPRRLSTTFKQMENEEAAAAAVYANGHITSDESDVEESPAGNSILLKSILKDTSMGGGRSRHSFRVSFSRQLVQQREISPAPDVPEANYNDSNSTDESDASDSDTDDNEYQVVDEVYTDDDGEDGVEAVDHQDEYDELKSRICELNKSHNGRRSVSPLIDVVKETPVQWFETTTPTKRRDEQAVEEQQFPPPTTAKKDNKTNLQLVDIITDWDDEEDDDEGDHSASNAEAEPSQQRVSEPRQSTNSNHHETNLDTMDISSSNLEDSIERLVELPPAPNALIEEEGVLPEEHIYPAAVDEQMPTPTVQITTEELVEVLTDDASEDAPDDSVVYEPQTQTPPEEVQQERSETPPPVEQPVELPPPPETTAPEEPTSPERVITPPIQFTTSAKRRFIQQNEDELISRLQNDMPLSQPSQSDTDLSELPTEEDPHKTFEKVSETLVEIAASFRDQPATVSSMPPPSETTTVNRTVVVQRKKGGGKRSISTDPVTASYFEAIEKTFAKPKAPPKQGGKKTDQKRKLYDATLSEVTEDEESMRVVKPVAVVAVPAKPQVEAPKLRELKVVVSKLRAEDYLSRKEPESSTSTVVVAARKVGRPPSKDRSRAAKGDGPKRARGRPKKVAGDAERSLQAEEVQTTPEESVLVNGVVEEPASEVVDKKKHRPKPNLVESEKEQRSDEVLPTVNGSSKEVGVEPEVQQKKKKPKPNLAGSLNEILPTVNGSSKQVVVEPETREEHVKQKKKKPKPNLAAVMQVPTPEQSPQEPSVAQDLPVEPSSESQQQQSDESLPAMNGSAEHDSKQKKKKKLKPNLAALVQDSSPEASVARNSESQSQQRMDESLPAANGSVEREASEDKPREKKKRLKPNLAALSPEPVVVQVEPVEQVVKEDGTKKKKLKPNLAAVSPESAPEPDQQTSKEDGAKKKKLKPNLAAVAQKSPPEPAVVVQVEPVEQVAKKKKLKPNLAKVLLEALPVEPPKETNVDQVATIAEKKKPKPNLEKVSQKSLPDPVVAQEPTVVQVEEPVEQSSKEVVTKKRKPKPNLAAASRESLPEPVITPVEPAQPVSKEDGAKKKRLKPNLAAVSPESLPEPTVVERVEPVEQVAKKKKLKPNLVVATQESPPVQPTKETIVDKVATVTEKRKTKPNLEKVSQKSLPEPVVAQVEPVEVIPSKSKQQHVEVEVRLEKVAPPAVAAKDKPADRQRKQKSRASLNEVVTTTAAVETATAEPKSKEPKVKLTKMDVAPMMQGSMSPASRAILLRAQIQPAASPRRLFADKLPGVTPLEEVQKEKKSDDPRKKRPKSKAQPMDPIPKVRISAEKDGIYRITTPSKEKPAQDSFEERLNVTESDNVRTSLEDNPEDFLGFEDNAENQDTAVDITMDLTRSFLEPVILLEPAKLPEGVEIQESSNATRKPRRRSKSPAKRTPKKSREPRPTRKSTDAASEPEMAQPEHPALENRSLPLKKRKSRDNSREVPAPPPPPPPPQEEPQRDVPVDEEVVLAGLNDSMLIPMLQRVPIADKYLVRSTPDRGTESTDYETDDTSSTTGDNVLIVRKDISRLDQSIAVDLEEEAERAANLNRKTFKRRESIPLPRFYGDNTFDLTWKPKSKHTGAGASRKNKRRLDNDSGIEEEDVVRRSKRTCRISKQILMTNPYIKSAYDRPDYRPMTVEQLAEAEQIAKKLKEENTRRRKPRAVPAAPSKPKRTPSRKRPQEPTEVPEEQQAKRTRADSALDEQPVPSTSAAAPCAEVAVQATALETIQQEKQQAQSWMIKLMAENSGREEVMPQATSTGDRMHFQLDHLTYQERNGIQYSFFIYSETENFGFLRFAPAAVKKWTKTADFLLKFLVLHGQLSFQINGKETVTKGGDFLMLPQNTRYRIQNSEEISLVFMIKFKTAQSELPSM